MPHLFPDSFIFLVFTYICGKDKGQEGICGYCKDQLFKHISLLLNQKCLSRVGIQG